LENFEEYLELREHVKAYLDDGDVDQPRFGYEEEDAVKIMELLKEKGSSFAPVAELALGCGLRKGVCQISARRAARQLRRGLGLSGGETGCGRSVSALEADWGSGRTK
jgi:hypothetical protein